MDLGCKVLSSQEVFKKRPSSMVCTRCVAQGPLTEPCTLKEVTVRLPETVRRQRPPAEPFELRDHPGQTPRLRQDGPSATTRTSPCWEPP